MRSLKHNWRKRNLACTTLITFKTTQVDNSLTKASAGYNNTSTLNYSYGLIKQQQVTVTVIELETPTECWFFNFFISDANKSS